MFETGWRGECITYGLVWSRGLFEYNQMQPCCLQEVNHDYQ